jgi:hypothetical protein
VPLPSSVKRSEKISHDPAIPHHSQEYGNLFLYFFTVTLKRNKGRCGLLGYKGVFFMIVSVNQPILSICTKIPLCNNEHFV